MLILLMELCMILTRNTTLTREGGVLHVQIPQLAFIVLTKLDVHEHLGECVNPYPECSVIIRYSCSSTMMYLNFNFHPGHRHTSNLFVPLLSAICLPLSSIGDSEHPRNMMHSPIASSFFMGCSLYKD